uniref:CRAL-TRIO domain-containing protein n=1 Tax=Anopheles dirus TaxID=7168 RepID=A0A182N7T0_9DIPT
MLPETELNPYGVDKCPETYDEYSFTLPELYRHVAKEELREDDEVREKALSEMRQWIADNPHIRKCRTDAKFLLRFLRFRQFSVPMACEALERYLTLRALYPSWFTNLDCTEEGMQEVLDSEPISYLGQDAAGRAVFLVRFGRFEGEKHNALQDARYMALVLESVLEWEELQVGGLQVLVDYTGCTRGNFEKWDTHDLKVVMDMYSRSYPLRYAEIHAAKLPKFAVPVIETFLSFANPKMREKIRITCELFRPKSEQSQLHLTQECPLVKMAPSLAPYPVEKCPKTYDEYKFTLPELYRDVAKEELREDDEVREKALAEMRQWIVDNPHIRKCRMDAKFLLRFLRFRQFSVPMACEALERYLTVREMHPNWFKNLDCNEPTMKEIFQNGPFIPLGRDESGRMVGYCDFARFDDEKHEPVHDGRYMALLMETMLESEEFQIGGCQVLIDFQGSTANNFEKWSTTDMMIMMDAYSHSYPMRYGEIHTAALPKAGIPVIKTFLSFASPKLREKINCYSTSAELEKHFEGQLKPIQYGGTLDLEEPRRALWKLLEEYREVVLGLDRIEIDVVIYPQYPLPLCIPTMASVQKVDKCPEKYDQYRPVSSALHRQIARDELREEPAIVEQALQQMRDWIAKNPAILACRTDANFLLRFLRVRKFSHVPACETLERYLVQRQRYPAWYSKLDTAEPWVQTMIDSEFVIPLGRDVLGRIVFLVRYANLDVDRFEVTDQIRFFTMVFESLFADELNQISGIVCIFDETNISMRAFAQWSMTNIKNYIECVTKALPIRVKMVHVANMPLFGATVGEWVMSCCSEKIRSRLKCYRSVEELITKTDLLKLLPAEYGGTQKSVDLRNQLRKSLDHHRNVILALDDMKLDEKHCAAMKNQSNPSNGDPGIIGSFRKLDVD